MDIPCQPTRARYLENMIRIRLTRTLGVWGRGSRAQHSTPVSLSHSCRSRRITQNQVRAKGNGDAKTDVYTHGHHASVVSQHSARTAADSAAFLLGHLSKGMRCLDVGCGPGSISVGLAKAVGPAGSLDAVDVEEEIVQQCQGRFEEAGVSAFARSRALSVYNLSDHFEENTFDVCYANQVLQHLSDPVRALREIKRVVKKTGGIVALRDADYASMLCHPTSPGIDRWREVYRQTARKNEAEPDAGRHLIDWTVSSGVFQRNAVEFTTDVKLYDSSDPEARRNWALSWRDRCLHSSFALQAVRYGVATEEEMREMADEWERWSSEPQGVFYYVIGQALIHL